MITTLLSAMRMAFVAIVRNKLRTGLTMLGILIGVAAVVVTTAIGTGARAKINDQIAGLGSNLMVVFPQSNQASGARGAQGAAARLTEGDARALVLGATSIAETAPYLRSIAQLVYEDRNVSTQVIGTTRSYFKVRNWPVRSGELWTEGAEQSGERVCVLGVTVAESLFGSLDPVGRTVRIGRHPFRVVGVLLRKGESPFGTDQDDVVMMPTASARSHLVWMPRRSVHGIMLSATSAETNEHAKAQANAILRERHRIDEGREPDFVIRTQAEFRASQDAIYGALSMLLLSVGAVSLLVGGIGIMNIMLVSVTERTREIGIRLAVGAHGRDVLTQFLIEAIILSVMGGALGVLLGVGASQLVSKLNGWPVLVSTSAIVGAVAFSAAIGVFFGFYPARKAAQLDPIEALRYE